MLLSTTRQRQSFQKCARNARSWHRLCFKKMMSSEHRNSHNSNGTHNNRVLTNTIFQFLLSHTIVLILHKEIDIQPSSACRAQNLRIVLFVFFPWRLDSLVITDHERTTNKAPEQRVRKREREGLWRRQKVERRKTALSLSLSEATERSQNSRTQIPHVLAVMF